MTHLTKNQSLGILGLTAGLLIVNTVAGRVVIKRHDEIKKQYNKAVEAGQDLARIANYQAKLIEKHIVWSAIDEFDRMVMDDMAADLNRRLDELRMLVEEASTKPSAE